MSRPNNPRFATLSSLPASSGSAPSGGGYRNSSGDRSSEGRAVSRGSEWGSQDQGDGGGRYGEYEQAPAGQFSCASCCARLGTWLKGTPFVTYSILLTIFALWIYSEASPLKKSLFLFDYSFCPIQVTHGGSFRTLFSAMFFHADVFHFLFNSLAILIIFRNCEKALGSLPFAAIYFVIGLCTMLLYAFIFYLGYAATNNPEWLIRCVVGASGQIFAFLIYDLYLLNVSHLPCCGFPIPVWLYPFLLLLISSGISRDVSFVGHLAGLLMGFVYVFGLLNYISLPRTWIIYLEETRLMSYFFKIPNTIKTPVDPPGPIEQCHLYFTRHRFGDTACGAFIERMIGKVLCGCSDAPCQPGQRAMFSSRGNVGGAAAGGGGGGELGSLGGGYRLNGGPAAPAPSAFSSGGAGYRLGDEDLEAGLAPAPPSSAAAAARAFRTAAHGGSSSGAAAAERSAPLANRGPAGGPGSAARADDIVKPANAVPVVASPAVGITAAAPLAPSSPRASAGSYVPPPAPAGPGSQSSSSSSSSSSSLSGGNPGEDGSGKPADNAASVSGLERTLKKREGYEFLQPEDHL